MVALWPMFIGVLVVDFGWWGQSRCLVNGGIVEVNRLPFTSCAPIGGSAYQFV